MIIYEKCSRVTLAKLKFPMLWYLRHASSVKFLWKETNLQVGEFFPTSHSFQPFKLHKYSIVIFSKPLNDESNAKLDKIKKFFYRYQYLLLLDHCLKIIATTVATFTKQKFYNFHIFFQSYHLILVDFWNSCRYIWPVIGHLWPLMTWWPLMTVFLMIEFFGRITLA